MNTLLTKFILSSSEGKSLLPTIHFCSISRLYVFKCFPKETKSCTNSLCPCLSLRSLSSNFWTHELFAIIFVAEAEISEVKITFPQNQWARTRGPSKWHSSTKGRPYKVSFLTSCKASWPTSPHRPPGQSAKLSAACIYRTRDKGWRL